MPCYRIDQWTPVVHPDAFVHPTAVLIGDVMVAAGCYIGPAASLRGDFGRIVIHAGANVQDTCVVHGFPGSDTVIEADGHIGHGAVLHGCTVRRNALVGMNAVVMDEAEVGENAFVAASAFVRAGMKIPAGHLVAGVPARVVRELSAAELAWKVEGTRTYQALALRCLNTMQEVPPLAEAEAGRSRIGVSDLKPLIAARRAR